MVPYLTKLVLDKKSDITVSFVKGDNTEPFDRAGCPPADFVISSYAMYVNCVDKLNGFTKHLFDAVNADGEVFLMVIHPDYEHTRERMDVLLRFGNILKPVLPDGGKYDEFFQYKIQCVPPYFNNGIEFDEFVVSSGSLRASLTASGFRRIEAVEILTAPGHEDLLDFARAFNLAIYRCSK